MFSNTSIARDERVEKFEGDLDLTLPASNLNEAKADVNGLGVTILDSANLWSPSIADSKAMDVDNLSLSTNGSSPMESVASRSDPELINDSDRLALPFVMMAMMLDTPPRTNDTGEHNQTNMRRPAGVEEIDNDCGSLFPAAMDSSLFGGNASKKVWTKNQDLLADNMFLQYMNGIGRPTELMPPTPFDPFVFEEHAENSKILDPPSVEMKYSNMILQQ